MSDTNINEYYPEKAPTEAPTSLVAGEAVTLPSDTPAEPLPVSEATPEEWKEPLTKSN